MKKEVYEIIIKPSAQKDFDSLPDKEVLRIAKRLNQLAEVPRPIGIQKLSDDHGYRIRTGNYRILFRIDDNNMKVFIYRIKHRKDAYR